MSAHVLPLLLLWSVLVIVVVPWTIACRDAAAPLFLSPLLHADRIDEAQLSSRITDYSEVLPSASYAAFLTTNTTARHLFFSLFSAEVSDAPLILWLQGGPGASSLAGFALENGPIEPSSTTADDDGWRLREHRWTRFASMLYIDQPAGSGFSVDDGDGPRSDAEAAADVLDVIEQLRKLFPQHFQVGVYVAGESYGAKIALELADRIAADSDVSLKGVALYSGWISAEHQIGAYADMLMAFGLATRAQAEFIGRIENKVAQLIAAGRLTTALAIHDVVIGGPTSTFHNITGMNQLHNILLIDPPTALTTYVDDVTTCRFRRALHVGNATFEPLSRAVYSRLIGHFMRSSARQLTRLLERPHLRVLLANGQLDFLCGPATLERLLLDGALGGEWTARFANTPRRLWRSPTNGQVLGYVRQLDVARVYQVVVRRAGHMVPMDEPAAAFDMMRRFVDGVGY